MTDSALDLVRQRIASRLKEAQKSATLSYLGMWLGVFDECEPWIPPNGLRQYGWVAEAAWTETDSSTEWEPRSGSTISPRPGSSTIQRAS